MADEVEERLESALKNIVNIAETGGYLKKDSKEDLQKAVSVIRECFITLKYALGNKNKENNESKDEVMEGINGDTQRREDSRTATLVLSVGAVYETASSCKSPTTPSVGAKYESSSSSQSLTTPTGSEENKDDNSETQRKEENRPVGQVMPSVGAVFENASRSQSSTLTGSEENKDDNGETQSTIDRLETSNGSTHKPHTGTELRTPSSEPTHKAASNQQRPSAASGTGQNEGNHSEETSTNEHVETATSRSHKALTDAEIEEKITEKVNHELQSMMKEITSNIKKIIKDEIKNAAQKSLGPIQREIDASELINSSREADVSNEGHTRSKRRWEAMVSREQGEITQTCRDQGDYVPEPDQNINKCGGEQQWEIVTRRRNGPERKRDSALPVNYRKETDLETIYQGERRTQISQHSLTTGSKKEDCDLEAADRMAWLYIGKLKQNTKTNNIKKFLERSGIEGNIECEELHTQGEKKAFKIGFPLSYLEDTQRTNFWPQGIVVRRYNFRRYKEDTEGERRYNFRSDREDTEGKK